MKHQDAISQAEYLWLHDSWRNPSLEPAPLSMPESVLDSQIMLDVRKVTPDILTGVDAIIHLAALLTPNCQQDPFMGCEVNVLGSVAIFELARACPTRLGSSRMASCACLRASSLGSVCFQRLA